MQVRRLFLCSFLSTATIPDPLLSPARSIWIGSTNPDHAASCRNDSPSVDDVLERDGIALAYIPLAPDDEFKNPLEVFSTWQFDFKEDETDRLIRLAKGASRARASLSPGAAQDGREADSCLLGPCSQLQGGRGAAQDAAQGRVAPEAAAAVGGRGARRTGRRCCELVDCALALL